MFKRVPRLLVLALCFLSLFSLAAAPAEYGPDEGSIRGAAFVDNNRNGVMDPGEQGLGWVHFTISSNGYSKMYHSEWQVVDSVGNEYATGFFGPAPLASGDWHVSFEVPNGYVATTPAERVVNVPGADGGHIAEVYMGYYPSGGAGASSVLPQTGARTQSVVIGALFFLGIGALLAVGLGLRSRSKS